MVPTSVHFVPPRGILRQTWRAVKREVQQGLWLPDILWCRGSGLQHIVGEGWL